MEDVVQDACSLTPALDMLRAAEIDGYRARRLLQRGDTADTELDIWFTTAWDKSHDRDRALAVATPVSHPRGAARHPESVHGSNSIVGVVDELLRVTHVAGTVSDVLWHAPAEAVGAAFLSFVHSDDAPSLLQALADAADWSGESATRVRLRRADQTWIPCTMTLSPMVDQSVPAFAFLAAPLQHAEGFGRSAQHMEECLRRIGRLVESAGVASASTMAAVPDLPGLARMTSREREVVTLLLRGERVPSIARTLFLSQTTIRNHLSSVFRKTGVHSQQELLHRMRGGPAGSTTGLH